MTQKLFTKTKNYIFYGWIILATATLGTFFSSPGQTYSISAFINNYIVDFDYSRTYISTIYSGATIMSGLLMVYLGKAVDRFGVKKMMITAVIFLAATTFFNSMVINLPMIFIGFFLLRFWGQGAMTLIPGTLVPQWFDRQRAFAFSIMSLGNIIGNLIVPIINIYLIENYHWRTAWQMWGFVLIVVFLPIVVITVINKPEDVGLLPDNQKTLNANDTALELEKLERESFTLNEAMKTRAFWSIGLISTVVPIITTGMMFHFYSLMDTKNVSPPQTAFVIGLMAFPGLFSPIVSKWIIDRISPKRMMTITLSAIALNMLFMLLVNSFVGAAIFIIIYGFSSSIQSISLNVIWVQFFGRKYLGSIRGAATVFTVIGSAFGTVPFGLSYDLTGSYAAVFIAMSGITFMSLLLALFVNKPEKTL